MGDGPRGNCRHQHKKKDHGYAQRIDILKTRLLLGHRLRVSRIVEEFGVSKRTAQRDIKRIEDTGLDLEFEDLDTGERVWRVPEKAREIKVRYSVLDVTALFLGRRMFDFLEDTTLADGLDRVYGRIEEQLTETELQKAKRMGRKVYLVHEGPKQLPPEASEILDSCLAGLQYEHKLKAVYKSPGKPPKEHILHPYTLAAYKRGLYLVAYTERANDCTTFSLERFVEMEWMRGEKFTYPQKYAPEIFFRSALFITPGDPEPIELIFSRTTEPFIRLRRFHDTQQIETLKDGRIRMTLTAPVNFETVNWVLSFGAHVEVIRPKKLRGMVITALKQALEMYG
jgi:predicted DNA-binding transcriptional regulator YafY